jgi:hypothetical protein
VLSSQEKYNAEDSRLLSPPIVNVTLDRRYARVASVPGTFERVNNGQLYGEVAIGWAAHGYWSQRGEESNDLVQAVWVHALEI